MSNELQRLAARRTQLVSQCAHQREWIAEELSALRPPFGLGAVPGYLLGHGKLKLALAGIALGLAAVRPRRMLSLATRAFAMWRTARGLLPLLQR